MSSLIYSHTLLAFLLILWCVLHSAMITRNAVKKAEITLGRLAKFYRAIYNTIAALTLLPIVWLMYNSQRIWLYSWPGMCKLIPLFLLILGFYLLYAGAQVYDLQHFLGLRQIRSTKQHIALSSTGGLQTNGILQKIRHPWYTAGLLILWAQPITSISLIVNIVFSAYLIIGARLEEKKLVEEFGQEYKDYQQRVSMLVPIKWLINKLA